MNKRKGSSLNHFWSSAPFSLCYFFCWIGKLVLLKKLLTRLVSSEYHDLQRMEKAMALIRAFLVGAEQKMWQSNAFSEWLRQIKPLVSNVKDIILDFEIEVLWLKYVFDGATSKSIQVFAHMYCTMFGMRKNL